MEQKNYPSNARLSREIKDEPEPTEKKVESVVEGKVIRRKKPLGTRFREVFFSGAGDSVFQHILVEVLLPAAKDMVVDTVTQAIERSVYGETRGGRRPMSRPGGNTFVSYNRFANATPTNTPTISPRARATHDFGEIVLASRPEADTVIDRLYDLLNKYEQVTLSDLYDLVNINSTYTDHNWGWTNLEGSTVRRVNSGYLLVLPRPEPLKR